MRAATGLQVNLAALTDQHKTNATRTARRLDEHGAHQLRIGIQFFFGNALGGHRMILADEGVDLLRQRGLARH